MKAKGIFRVGGDQPMDSKRAAGEKAAEYVKNGMSIGLGTGSTVYWTIVKLGEMVKEGLRIEAMPTSEHTSQIMLELGIPQLKPYPGMKKLDLTIDGADEVSSDVNLIKGGGGALLREKMIASYSSLYITVVDHSKCVSELGQFPLPVEVIKFGWEVTSIQIGRLGCAPVLRMKDEAPFLTDNGNYILDCSFELISKPAELTTQLNRIPGVAENGLFVNMTNILIVGRADGMVRIHEN
jgi:ribose 5-phosphate isomerase A